MVLVGPIAIPTPAPTPSGGTIYSFGIVSIQLSPIPLGQLLQIIAVSVGVVLTIWQLQRGIRAQRISNLLAITKNHRELWSQMSGNPELAKLLSTEQSDGDLPPITADQRLFLNFLLLHMASTDAATRAGVLARHPHMEEDVGITMSRPNMSRFWKTQKRFHLRRFVKYVDRAVARYQKSLRPNNSPSSQRLEDIVESGAPASFGEEPDSPP